MCSSFIHAAAAAQIYPLSLHDALPISGYPLLCPRRLFVTQNVYRLPAVSVNRNRTGSPATLASEAPRHTTGWRVPRSEEHTSELQSQSNLVCRLPLEKKNNTSRRPAPI